MTAIGKATHTTKWIPVKDISVVWERSQRHYHKKWARKISEEFDPDMFGVLAVCPAENGTYHSIDGQHRRAAVEMLWGENEMVPCNVFKADSPERAAQLFDALNTARRPLQPLEIFSVRVTGKLEPELSVHKIVTGLGYKVSASKEDGNIAAVTACVATYKEYGKEGLLGALLLIREIWGKASASVDAPMIRGFAEFLATHGKDIDDKRLVSKVAKIYTPGRLLGAAKSARELFRGSVPKNICRVLVETYNTGLRKDRLEE